MRPARATPPRAGPRPSPPSRSRHSRRRAHRTACVRCSSPEAPRCARHRHPRPRAGGARRRCGSARARSRARGCGPGRHHHDGRVARGERPRSHARTPVHESPPRRGRVRAAASAPPAARRPSASPQCRRPAARARALPFGRHGRGPRSRRAHVHRPAGSVRRARSLPHGAPGAAPHPPAPDSPWTRRRPASRGRNPHRQRENAPSPRRRTIHGALSRRGCVLGAGYWLPMFLSTFSRTSSTLP